MKRLTLLLATFCMVQEPGIAKELFTALKVDLARGRSRLPSR